MYPDHLFYSFRLTLKSFRFLFISLVLLLFLSGCARREAFNEESEEVVADGGTEGKAEVAVYRGKLLAQVVSDSVIYIVQQQELIQPFIREFGDGTVVDKVMIRKVQETEEDTAAYYLVGLGLHSGAFRSMALELDVAANNALYLSGKGGKHMCMASVGCNFCYFTFSGNKITGCECASRAAGDNCVHKVSETNTLLERTQVGNSRRGGRR